MLIALAATLALAGSESDIRATREAFNIAITNRDAETIASLLAPGYHIVTGRSEQSHGAGTEREKWAARFAADPGVTYRRTPRQIRVNEAWGLAEETGDWQGSYTTAGKAARASGVYAAKWQRATDGRWLIQSEVFTTLTCQGPAAACPPPDPIGATSQSSAVPPPHPVKNLKVTILSTMLAGGTQGTGEWGFAALVETDGKKLLIDTGARAETVLENAAELGIDLSDVTDLVITHNHADHTGGLVTLRRELRTKNPKALSRAHVGAGIFEPRLQAGGKDMNGLLPSKSAYEGLGGAFVVYDKPKELFPGVWLTGPVPRVHKERNWSGSLQVKFGGSTVEDTVAEDSALVIETAQGLVVVTGCGHAGAVNIVDYSRKIVPGSSVYALIGGLHLFAATDEQLTWTAGRLSDAGLVYLLGAHCTGIEAVFRMRDLANLSRRTAVVGSVGSSFSLDSGIDPLALAK